MGTLHKKIGGQKKNLPTLRTKSLGKIPDGSKSVGWARNHRAHRL